MRQTEQEVQTITDKPNGFLNTDLADVGVVQSGVDFIQHEEGSGFIAGRERKQFRKIATRLKELVLK